MRNFKPVFLKFKKKGIFTTNIFDWKHKMATKIQLVCVTWRAKIFSFLNVVVGIEKLASCSQMEFYNFFKLRKLILFLIVYEFSLTKSISLYFYLKNLLYCKNCCIIWTFKKVNLKLKKKSIRLNAVDNVYC